jgi:phosphoglycolate phosphatase
MPSSFPCARHFFIFDLDGTLIDSRDDIARAVNSTLTQFHLPSLPVSIVARFVGEGLQKLIERVIREVSGQDADPDQVQKMIKVFKSTYEEHMLDSTTLCDGVVETLEKLWWVKFAVVSNKPEKFSRLILQGLGVADRFEVIFGGDSLGKRKPDPAPLLRAMAQCGFGPEESVIVGDSVIDIVSGKAAGILTCGVTGGFGERKELEAAGCDLIIDKLNELPNYFHPNRGRTTTNH